MNRLTIAMLRLAACGTGRQAWAVTPGKPTFDTYSGYVVSNRLVPNAAESFAVITDQSPFGRAFGVAFAMGGAAHRWPKDTFN